MSQKKKRSWFVCPQWADMVSGRYASEAEAARALRSDPKVLARLQAGVPVAKSTVIRILKRYRDDHGLDVAVSELIRDVRRR